MEIGNIILIVVLGLLLVMYPVLMFRRNKREQEKQKVLVESLKVGEYVITYSGVFGKIVEIVDKEMGKFVTIETGEAHKNYVTISVNAIYMQANNNPKVYDTEGNEIKEEVKEPIESKPKKTSK